LETRIIRSRQDFGYFILADIAGIRDINRSRY